SELCHCLHWRSARSSNNRGGHVGESEVGAPRSDGPHCVRGPAARLNRRRQASFWLKAFFQSHKPGGMLSPDDKIETYRSGFGLGGAGGATVCQSNQRDNNGCK